MNKFQWIGVLFLLLLFIALAGTALNADSIRLPEHNSILHTGFIQNQFYTIQDSATSVRLHSPQHAPLYYILLSIWYRLMGIHPMLLRVPSLFFALLTAAFVYRTGQYLDRRWGGIIALFCLTLSSYNLFYAHEIRNYTILTFASIIAFWSYWRIVTSKQPVRWTKWLWLYASSVWCVYVHYFGIFVLLGIGIYHLIIIEKNRRWLQIALVEILAGITFLPWLNVLLKGSDSRVVLTPDSQNAFEVIYRHLFIYSNGLGWLTIALILLIFWQLRKSKIRYTFLPYLVIVTTTMLLAIVAFNEISTVIPIRRMRYTMVWLPQIILVITAGILTLSKYRWLQILLLGCWIGGFVWMNQSTALTDYTGMSTQKGHKFPNYQVIADMYNNLPGETETVVSVSHDVWVPPRILDYYELLTGYEFLHLTDDFSAFTVDMRQFQMNQMNRVRLDFSFWVLSAPHFTDLQTVELFQSTVSDLFRPCLTYIDTPTVNLTYYVRSEIPCELLPQSPLPLVQYDNGMQLLNATLEQEADNLIIYTWWDNKPAPPYGFSIQLFDADSNKVAQGDFLLPVNTIQVSQLDLPNLPAGEFHVNLVLYDVETVTSVNGINNLTDESFERFVQIGKLLIDNDTTG